MNLFGRLETFPLCVLRAGRAKALLHLCLYLAPLAAAAQDAPAVKPIGTPLVERPSTDTEETNKDGELLEAPSPVPAATSESKELTSPVAAPPPAILKTARDETYNKPTYFESMENLLPTMELDYDLTLKEGRALRIGDVLLDEQSFFFAIAPVSRFHSKMGSVVSSQEAEKEMLVIRWPEALLTEGTLEVISRTGGVLWKQDITEGKRGSWKRRLDSWKKKLEGVGIKASHLSKSSVFSTQYGLEVDASGLKPGNESFRFCLNNAQGPVRSRLCSQRYVIRNNGKHLALVKVKSSVSPRVLLQSETAALKQSRPVSLDSPTSFFAELAGGEVYEFIAVPNKLNLMDLTDTKTPGQIRIVGWGTRPTIPSTILNPDSYSSLTKVLGFEPTIGDMRKFWEAFLPVEQARVYLPGKGGGIFTQRFELENVPMASVRPYLHAQTPTGTYTDGVKLFGKKDPEVQLTSLENSIEVEDQDPRYFLWRFKAAERGEINRSYLSMAYRGKEYKGFYEVYMGFPRELSVRLSGLVSPTGENVFMGEAAYNHWFENLLGWTNYWVGRQRWGVSAKYFKSLTQLSVGTTAKADLTVINADLKYRLQPGLWGRDETLGAMVDYQDLRFGQIKASMIGVGAFWARSMPKVFDSIINVVPMMRYEKWVDMEFIFYPVSLSSRQTLQTNFALNFHGKVLWTKNWFGEAGFGIKRYAIMDLDLQQKAALSTFYGTFGVGLNF